MADRAKIPSWLTKAYLQEILQKNFSTDLEVKSFTAVPPVAGGANFASLILRVISQCIEKGVEKEYSFIVKTVHFNDDSAKMVEESGIHKKEMIMYSDILPKVKKLLKSIGDNEQISPNTIYVDHEHQAMIFEDMKCSNFKLGNKKVGTDWEHMKIVVRKLAKLHAGSMVLAEQGEKFNDFQRGMFSEDVHVFDFFFVLMCSELGEEVQRWPGYEKLGAKLVKVSEHIAEQGVELWRKQPGQLFALNHGDCSINNLLFKYDENGQVEDAVLVDFQICNYASPIFDISYLFHTSAVEDIKFDQMKLFELLQIYHQHLTETLQKLDSQIKSPTLYKLCQEYSQRSFSSVVFMTLFPIMINESEEDSDMQNVMAKTDKGIAFRKKLFSNPRTVRALKYFLPFWEVQGLLDPLK